MKNEGRIVELPSEMLHKFDVLNDKVEGLNNKVEVLNGSVDGLSKRTDYQTNEIKSMNKRLGNMEKETESHFISKFKVID